MTTKPFNSARQLLICCTLLLLASASPAAPASGHKKATPATASHLWDVEYILWAPDCQQRVMIGINGEFPGPTIRARAGELLNVTVKNSLHTEGLVIHWHGIKQVYSMHARAATARCASINELSDSSKKRKNDLSELDDDTLTPTNLPWSTAVRADWDAVGGRNGVDITVRHLPGGDLQLRLHARQGNRSIKFCMELG